MTPNDKMFQSMAKFTDVMCGEEPMAVETTRAAQQRRENRKLCMDYLHRLVHLSMREGAARAMGTHSPSGIMIRPSVPN